MMGGGGVLCDASSNASLTRYVIFVNLLSAASLSLVASSKLVSCSEFASNHFEFEKFVTNPSQQVGLGLAVTKQRLT